jgi:hypothetical protein
VCLNFNSLQQPTYIALKLGTLVGEYSQIRKYSYLIGGEHRFEQKKFAQQRKGFMASGPVLLHSQFKLPMPHQYIYSDHHTTGCISNLIF